MKNILYQIVVLVLFSSCSGTKFLNRKYTNGIFFENKNSGLFSKNEVKNESNRLSSIISKKAQSNYMSSSPQVFVDTLRNEKIKVLNEKLCYSNITKHNTIYADTTKCTSLVNQIYLKTNKIFLENYFEMESIVKKDSVFIKQKRGSDSVYGKICATPPVIVVLNENNKIVKTIKGRQARKLDIERIKENNSLALKLSFIPVFGLIFLAMSKNRLGDYNNIFKTVNSRKTRLRNLFATFISILSLILFVIAFSYLAINSSGGF